MSADLVSDVGDAGTAEVHPRGDGGAGSEDQPIAADGLHLGKQVHQGENTQQPADDYRPKAEAPLLEAGADGRQRQHQAGGHRGSYAGIVESDEAEVTDQRCQCALDRELDVLVIVEGIR